MRARGARFAWTAAVLGALGCRNDTLFQPCTGDADCTGGLECLAADDLIYTTPADSGLPLEKICTRTCTADADCPVEAGCAGTGDQRRATCSRGVCALKLCD